MRTVRAVCLAALACTSLHGCGGSTTHGSSGSASATTGGAGPASTGTAAPSQHTHAQSASPQPPPGSLPQTDGLPSGATAGFHDEMAALWQGIRTNSVQAAMPAFFPEGAYAQVKAISDPRTDYVDRLLGEYRLDIAAAHDLLGPHASGAQLVDVVVPGSYAHWVGPGTCYNQIGYYEVPNSRLVYREDGEIRSFGIASLISWRGIWYVVHLGAVVRSGDAGVVDDPGTGAGTPAPSSTC